LKTTLMLQVVLPARLDPQVVDEMAKSPVVDGEMPVTAEAPLFANLKVLAALVPPTAVAGKVALAGVSVISVAPVPVSETVCGLFGALSVTVTVPVRVPVWVGLKVTLNLQL
jgi:hypothetical protein